MTLRYRPGAEPAGLPLSGDDVDTPRRADPPVWHRLFTGPIPAPAIPGARDGQEVPANSRSESGHTADAG